EEAIEEGARYAATVRAASESTAFRLPAREFKRWADGHLRAREYFAHFLSHVGLQQFLKRFTALGTLSAEQLSGLVESLTVESFPSGAAIVREGDAADALYIVQSGVAQVVQGAPQPRLINQLASGDVFGELSLLHD